MTTTTIDALALRAARFTRRRSLLTLGGAALAATTATAVGPASARKKNKNNNKNNRGKGNGADCKKRERQRCANDTDACKATVRTLCPDLNDPECLAAQACCDGCSASTLLACVNALNQA